MAATFGAITATQFLAGSAGIGALAGVMGTAASYNQAKAQKRAAEQNARIASHRARLTYDQAQRDNRRHLAQIAAKQAASGMIVGQGTNLLVLSDAAKQLEERALIQRYSGIVDANNASNRAGAYGSQASSGLILGGAHTASGLLSAGYLYKTNFAGGSGTSAAQQTYMDNFDASPDALYAPAGSRVS